MKLNRYKFQAYYDSQRFRYIEEDLLKTGLINKKGNSRIRKTGEFHSDKYNVYIDTSDGVNEDMKVYEYCGRILRIVEDCKGKPFLFLKSAFSPVWSKKLIEIAENNNGKVVPFFKWSFNDRFYDYLIPNRNSLIDEKNRISKSIDIGFAANLKSYRFPNPDQDEPRVSWADKRYFGFGSGTNTGYMELNSRKKLYELLKNKSRFSFFHVEKINYEEFIKECFKWITCLNPPGYGEYTSRMFDHTFLHQCVILRKTSYDFGYSWKQHLPEVDFNSPEWPDELQNIIDNYKEWEEKCGEYFDKYWSAKSLVDYLQNVIEKFENNL